MHLKHSVKVSVVLFTYQQELVVRESLESLINQDYPDLQIVVSDDASTDKTWEIIEQTARQARPNVRLVLNRNETNLGIIGNYNRAVSLCDGDLIFSAAGDDISEVNRVHACVELWQSTGQTVDLIATDLSDMAFDGEVLGLKTIDDLQTWDWERWISRRPYHAGASHMVTRRLISVQPLSAKAKLEDQCLLFRALLMGGALRLPQALVRHRRGGVSNNGEAIRTYASKRNMLIASATQGIHETDHYLSDAQILKAPVRLVKYLTQLRRDLEFTGRCLEATSIPDRLDLMREYGDVSIRTRLRFFLFSTFQKFYSALFTLKAVIKDYRRH